MKKIYNENVSIGPYVSEQQINWSKGTVQKKQSKETKIKTQNDLTAQENRLLSPKQGLGPMTIHSLAKLTNFSEKQKTQTLLHQLNWVGQACLSWKNKCNQTARDQHQSLVPVVLVNLSTLIVTFSRCLKNAIR